MVERRLLVGEHVVAAQLGLPHLPAEPGFAELDRYWGGVRQPFELPGGHALGRGLGEAVRGLARLFDRFELREPGPLYRYGYNAATETYSLDVGFPVQIGNYKTEALTIAKDSTGQLWATWKQGTTFVVNASVCNPVCNDAVWGTPFTPDVPGTKTTFDSDDNSAVIAFAGKVGVLWSNQTNGTDYFAIHGDSDSDTTWAGETALSGPDMADDHMNLKTDSSGRVYAVVKTSRGGSTDPLVMLLVRSTSGSWTSTTVGLKRDHHTRAIVELDEVDQIIHVFATSPSRGEASTRRHRRWAPSPSRADKERSSCRTPTANSTTPPRRSRTSARRPVSSSSPRVGNASISTSTSPSVAVGEGLLADGCIFATPTSGAAPLAVQFTDTSSGGPTAWQWDFQNDGTVDSTQQNPSFVSRSPGTYSVKLTVSECVGRRQRDEIGYITVTTAGPTLTFTPTDDAFVRSNHPDENNGSLDNLRSWKGSGQTNSFLKFSVSGVTGAVSSAKLRLYVVQQSPSAGNVFPVADTSWAEGTITWATSPTIGSTRIGQGGPASLGTWIEIDLGSAISGNGTFSLALVGASNTPAWLSSREGANPPQLVLTQS